MKVYTTPVPFDVDYENYDYDKTKKTEGEHEASLVKWLRANGYDGKRTGETVAFPVCDGYALYMLAEGRNRSVLIHLPYGDAYQYPDVRFLPKSEIIRRIARRRIFQKEWEGKHDAKTGT